MNERVSNQGVSSEPPGRSWSIAARTTWWFALTTAAVVLAVCAVSGAFLTRSTKRHIDALLAKDLEEFEVKFQATPESLADAEAIIRGIEQRHPSNPMAWRIWDSNTGGVWLQVDETGLLTPTIPAPQPLDETNDASDAERWRSERVQTHFIVGLVLDGRDEMELLHGFGALSLLLAGTAGVIAFVAGALFIRRSCALLRNVSEKVRNVHAATGTADLELPDAPDEIRDIVDALRHALANIRAEMDRAHLMTTGLAHEFGSPLQNLIGETEVALISERTPEEYKRVLKSHLEELRDLGHAVGNLMTLCSVESGAGGDVERFDLGHETDLRLRREHAHAQRRGVRLEVVQEGDLALVGDREALLLAVGNVVANAIDWAPAGSDVRLALLGRVADVQVTVDDSGPGVSAEEIARIFEPFYRGPAASGKRAGYGLGLSIAKRAVEAQGGSLEVARSPLGGARFTLLLPRDRTAKR